MSAFAPVRPQTLFFDDFPGTSIDASKWTVYNRIADLVNSEVNGMVPEAVIVNDGLSIVSTYVSAGYSIGDSESAPQTVFYKSGQIASKFLFKYGTALCRAKMPGGTGLWPLFWLLGYKWQYSQPFTANTPEHDWPNGGWGEIDIAEFLAGSRTTDNCAVWFGNATTGNGSASGGTMPFDATSRFMVYRLEWYPNLLRWSVDAEDGNGFQTLRTVTDPTQIPNVPMYVILSTAIGGAAGAPDSATFPQTYSIAYVKVIP
jgi:beta-glucanase (GH16 family)